MAYGTMEVIQTVTVGSGGQATIDFQNIPNTYSDLLLKISARDGSGFSDAYLTFNGSTSNYTDRLLYGTGATAGTSVPTGTGIICIANNGSTSTASTFCNAEIYIPNYSGSNNKSVSIDAVSENNGTTAYQYLVAGLWADVSAINRIVFTPSSNLVQHTTATLYGITRVPAGAKATGGVIYDDASYWYHVFTSSGTFTPSQNITCDYVVVAGGGGGSGTVGGFAGGGAGGLRSTVSNTGGGGALESALSLTANTNYTVTIGAGGTGGNFGAGTQGGNSVFSTITSTGGGFGGGGSSPFNGGSGGSGGGGGADASTAGSGGAASPSGQGYAGGNAIAGAAGTRAMGGGGGAGAVGANATSGTGGNGGNGTWTALSNAVQAGQLSVGNYYLAGGGGGATLVGTTRGTGGLGGGGAAVTNSPGTAGTANTGGGGAGGDYTTGLDKVGGNGGSGIVIVRYAK